MAEADGRDKSGRCGTERETRPHGFGDVPGDGKAEAGSMLARVEPRSDFERPVDLFRRHAWTVIDNGYVNSAIVRAKHRRLNPLGGPLSGVIQKDGEQFREVDRIDSEATILAPFDRQPEVNFGM